MKKYDIVATIGSYTNNQGEEKKRYENVGAVMQGQHGPYLMLKKTFNPAGLAEADRDSILLSLFEPKAADGGQQKPASTQHAQPAPAADDFDSIPF